MAKKKVIKIQIKDLSKEEIKAAVRKFDKNAAEIRDRYEQYKPSPSHMNLVYSAKRPNLIKAKP